MIRRAEKIVKAKGGEKISGRKGAGERQNTSASEIYRDKERERETLKTSIPIIFHMAFQTRGTTHFEK